MPNCRICGRETEFMVDDLYICQFCPIDMLKQKHLKKKVKLKIPHEKTT